VSMLTKPGAELRVFVILANEIYDEVRIWRRLLRVKHEITVGHFGGAPVTLHWTLLLFFIFAGAATRSIVGGLVAFAAMLILLLMHELGHAVVARWLGLRVIAIRLYGFHGICVHTFPETEGASVAVAWGGVLAQIVLFAVVVTIAKILSSMAGGIPWVLDPAFFVWAPLNLLVIFTNLLPITPLDGAVAWKGIPVLLRTLFGRRKARKHENSKDDASKVVSMELRRISRSKEEQK